jgi:hypothetical protein
MVAFANPAECCGGERQSLFSRNRRICRKGCFSVRLFCRHCYENHPEQVTAHLHFSEGALDRLQRAMRGIHRADTHQPVRQVSQPSRKLVRSILCISIATNRPPGRAPDNLSDGVLELGDDVQGKGTRALSKEASGRQPGGIACDRHSSIRSRSICWQAMSSMAGVRSTPVSEP